MKEIKNADLQGLPPATLLWTCHLGTPCVASCSQPTSFIKYAISVSYTHLKAERGKNATLAYSFDIALQNEFALEENIALAMQFLLENCVSRGMVVDFAVHQPDREDGGIPNPHFHVLCPIRPIELFCMNWFLFLI